ncbi:MAG: zinc ribbon domain-containing protein [Glaciimonas sp.]|nr:zinc ribbon domain-containing protein [Glaciimonas sp.]
MPIYAYRCDACGFAKDVLQKMSDAQLTICPTCHKGTFQKQVTAAGFQLKGTGWYVTDFRGGADAVGPAKGITDGASSSSSEGAATPASAATTTPANSASSTPATSSGTSATNITAASTASSKAASP